MKQEVIEITVSTHGKTGAKDALCHRAVFGLFAWAAADPALARLFLARLVAPVCLHFIAGLQLHLAHIYWTLSPVQRFPPRCHWSLLRPSISGQIAVLNCRTFEGFYSSSFCLKSLKALRWIPHGKLSCLYTRGSSTMEVWCWLFPHMCVTLLLLFLFASLCLVWLLGRFSV